VARYTYAPGYIDDIAVQERDLNDDQDFADANEVVYYHQNTLFSVYALTDGSENVVERCRYDAYGGCAVLDSDGSADADGLSDVGNAYAFTGRRLDLESTLMQYRHRNYSPTLGRFISRDPKEYADNISMYSYVGAQPLKLTDPTGEWILPALKAMPCLMCASCFGGTFLGCFWECGRLSHGNDEFDRCFGECMWNSIKGTVKDCKDKCAKSSWRKLHACTCTFSCAGCLTKLLFRTGGVKFPYPGGPR